MRVIAGLARGRRLVAPPGRDVRPTADRVREALYSSLGPSVEDVAVLDCYAGSGALGIEALSRGARSATFVERDARAAEVIRRNLAATALAGLATVVQAPVERFCAHPSGGPYALVLADPPYAVGLREVHDRLADLERAGALAPDVLVVVERSRRDAELSRPPPRFLAPEARRTYGDTVLLRYRRAQPAEQDGSRAP